jgi:hypothetical protein
MSSGINEKFVCVCDREREMMKLEAPEPSVSRLHSITVLTNHIYFKYTQTKLISLFNVIPLDFNAPVPAFHTFFLIPSEKKTFWLRL